MFGDLQLDLEAIDSAIKSCAGPKGNPECLSGAFQSLKAVTAGKTIDYVKASPASRKTLSALSEFVECIHADLCNILKSCIWIEYVDVSRQNADDAIGIVYKKSLEVCLHAFHVEFRSISDYVAGIVLYLLGKNVDPNMVSFKQVVDWLAEPDEKYSDLSGIRKELSAFKSFYKDIAHVRNAIVHKGADAIVVLEDPAIDRRLGFGILVKKLDRMIVMESMPPALFNVGVVDLRVYIGLAIGFMIRFLNGFSDETLKLLHNRQVIALEETVHPYFPSSCAKLIALAGRGHTLKILQHFPAPRSVPEMIAIGLPLTEVLQRIDAMEPIKIKKTAYMADYAPGSLLAIRLMEEAKNYLASSLEALQTAAT